jgi:spore germination cell wall hydrolase CwlJ-like protein
MLKKVYILILALISVVTLFLIYNFNDESILPVRAGYHALTKEVKKQVTCLAENIYFEAGHEPQEGKKAVAFVTINRVQTGNYANNICGVVYQKVNGTCQFTWVCDPGTTNKLLTIKNTPLYNDILKLSTNLYLNFDRMEDNTNGATYYHADYVEPGWKLKKEKQIGRHIFYIKHSDKIDRNKGFI